MPVWLWSLATTNQVGNSVAIERMLPSVSRVDVVSAALGKRVRCSAPTPSPSRRFRCRFRPEHLLLALDDAESVLPDIRNAGCVSRRAVLGGLRRLYDRGNHVLPTGGLARSYSGLDRSTLFAGPRIRR